jgi:hypothetical protein
MNPKHHVEDLVVALVCMVFITVPSTCGRSSLGKPEDRSPVD